jgi:hypothetical protein
MMRSLRTDGLLALTFAAMIAAPAPLSAASPVGLPPMAVEQRSPVVMEHPQAAYLARAALMSLHDAMISDNYTVLRELGSTAFQASSVSNLASGLRDLKARKLDLGAAAAMKLRIVSLAPSSDGRRVVMRGEFDTTPEMVQIDFTFERVGPQWRHAALGVALITRDDLAR